MNSPTRDVTTQDVPVRHARTTTDSIYDQTDAGRPDEATAATSVYVVSAAIEDGDDLLFWDAYWTLDDEWHDDEWHPDGPDDAVPSGSGRQAGSTSRRTPATTSWSTGTSRVAVPSASPPPRLRA